MHFLSRENISRQIKALFSTKKANPVVQPPSDNKTKVQKDNAEDTEVLKGSLHVAPKSNIPEIMNDRKAHLNPMMAISYADNPIKVLYARGQYLIQEDGNRILDCINNVSHIGHCHPYYVMQLNSQSQRLLTNSRFLYDELMTATHKLLKRLPSELSVVTFVNSGSQANDLAMQMAEIHSRKKGIICLDGAYHGITKSCIEVSPYKWSEHYKKSPHITVANSPCSYRGMLKGVPDPSSVYADYLSTLVTQDLGAFISQYMQSCGGQIVPPKDLYQQAYKKLRERGVVCIGDEVQTGFGRLGDHFWAFQYYGVVPDILTVGKAMGNGFPVAAVICRPQIAESYKNMDMQFFSTYGGNPMAMTAVNAVLDVIDLQSLQEKAADTGAHLNSRLKEEILPFACVGDIRGMGLFQGIDIVKSKESREEDGALAKKIIMALRKKNILVSRDGMQGNVLKIKPPMAFDKQNANTLIDNLKETLTELAVK